MNKKLEKLITSSELKKIPWQLSELVAINGLPIRALAKIQRLRAGLGAQGYHFPINAKSIKSIVMKHSLEVKDIYKKQFEEMKTKFILALLLMNTHHLMNAHHLLMKTHHVVTEGL